MKAPNSRPLATLLPWARPRTVDGLYLVLTSPGSGFLLLRRRAGARGTCTREVYSTTVSTRPEPPCH